MSLGEAVLGEDGPKRVVADFAFLPTSDQAVGNGDSDGSTAAACTSGLLVANTGFDDGGNADFKASLILIIRVTFTG